MECTVDIKDLGRCYLSIEMIEDMWFVIRVNYHDGEFWKNKYFLCDQIDGLLKFLEGKTIDNSKLHEGASYDGYERVGKYDNYEFDDMEDFENIMDFWNTTTVKFSELDIKRFNTIFDPLHYKIVFSQLNDRLLTYLNPRHKIYIKKFDDEYYGIKFHDDHYEQLEKYYRCDQWEGLVNCLKREFNV